MLMYHAFHFNQPNIGVKIWDIVLGEYVYHNFVLKSDFLLDLIVF